MLLETFSTEKPAILRDVILEENHIDKKILGDSHIDMKILGDNHID